MQIPLEVQSANVMDFSTSRGHHIQNEIEMEAR
jgi:hypothetical protein